MYTPHRQQKLLDTILSEISVDNIAADTRELARWHRYSGTEDGEEAAAYLLRRMEEHGVPCEPQLLEGMFSIPVYGRLDITWPVQKRLEATVCGDSGAALRLSGPFYYDYMSRSDSDQKLRRKRFSAFQGKIVLTHGKGVSAFEAQAYGALGLIYIYDSPDALPHFGGSCHVWGTPTMEDTEKWHSLPCLCITRQAGDEIIALLERGGASGSITAVTDNQIRKATMPIVRIAGNSPNYVMVSGHYDSHAEGVTDNGASNAIMIELARVFYQHRDLLDRSILIAQWAGHSDGRYAGSTWFADHFHQELQEQCVAHVNIDLAGCKNAHHVRARTTRMEGQEFTNRIIRQYTGLDPAPYIPMPHAADMSFLAKEIPLHIMMKYEVLPEERTFSGPSGGPWWHTIDDTIDKFDAEIGLRDALMNAEIICRIANSPQLPVDLVGFVAEMERFLEEIGGDLAPGLSLEPVTERLPRLKQKLADFTAVCQEDSDTDAILKKVAGSLVRMVYTESDGYRHDPVLPTANFHKLRSAMGLRDTNCQEDYYLFVRVDFLRHRNRLVGELDRLTEAVDAYLARRRRNL